MLEYQIVHDIPGRMRIRYGRYRFSRNKALALHFALCKWDMVESADVNERTGSILFTYSVDQRDALIDKINSLDIPHFDDTLYEKLIKENKYLIDHRDINDQYIGKFTGIIVRRYASKWFLPLPIRNILTIYHTIQYVKEGLDSLVHKRIDVPVLDATSISVSLLSGQWNTARNIMFLLNISSLLEDYTKKTTSLQLKETLSVNIDKVWVLEEGKE